MPSEDIRVQDQPWFKRLKTLAAHAKTPEAIAKDVVCALHTLESADASGYARGRAEAVEECRDLCNVIAVRRELAHRERDYNGGAHECVRELDTLSHKDTRHEV